MDHREHNREYGKEHSGERLQQYLDRFFALRQHRGETLFLSRLQRFQDWQRQRLTATHHALLDDPLTAPGVMFLLDDVYGGRDLLPVAREIRRALPKAMKLLPERIMATSASALEAAIITQELDEAAVTLLGERLDTPLDEHAYIGAYRALGHRQQRHRQLQLVMDLGQHLDRHVRSRMIRTTFRLVRKPAHAAGFANLYDFMERSFRAMKPVPSVARLLGVVVARETVIMERLFAGHPAPFTGD